MGAIKDIYDVLRISVSDLKNMAKKAKNQEMIELSLEIQDKVFEIKDEMQNLKDRNLQLMQDLNEANKLIIDYEVKLKDYNQIKERLSLIEGQNRESDLDLSSIQLSLNFTEIIYFFSDNTIIHEETIKTNLSDVFKKISLKMITPVSKQEFMKAFELLCPGYYLKEEQVLQIKAQLLSLNLISVSTNKKDEEMIVLTDKGKKIMQELNKF